MKKIIFVTGILWLLLAVAGCSSEDQAPKAVSGSNINIPTGTTQSTPTAAATESVATPAVATVTPTKPPVSTPTPAPKKDIIIAKSDESVSNKEKEDILNEVDKLLDDILKNVNEIDSSNLDLGE